MALVDKTTLLQMQNLERPYVVLTSPSGPTPDAIVREAVGNNTEDLLYVILQLSVVS